jgi:hypothetical protein
MVRAEEAILGENETRGMLDRSQSGNGKSAANAVVWGQYPRRVVLSVVATRRGWDIKIVWCSPRPPFVRARLIFPRS